jgi:hypothetical protein
MMTWIWWVQSLDLLCTAVSNKIRIMLYNIKLLRLVQWDWITRLDFYELLNRLPARLNCLPIKVELAALWRLNYLSYQSINPWHHLKLKNMFNSWVQQSVICMSFRTLSSSVFLFIPYKVSTSIWLCVSTLSCLTWKFELPHFKVELAILARLSCPLLARLSCLAS